MELTKQEEKLLKRHREVQQNEEYQFLHIMEDILETGIWKDNRTGMKTKSLFNQSMSFNLTGNKHILMTTRKTFQRGGFEELMMFLNGITDTKLLEEKGINFWKGNTSREFLDNKGLSFLPEGEMGCSYPHAWRNHGGSHPLIPQTKNYDGFDQIKDVYEKLLKDRTSRYIIIDGWQPQLHKYSCLPCCHTMYIFNVNTDTNELNCHLTQRSSDFYLASNINVSTLSLLTHILAKATGLKVGKIGWTGIDVHLYQQHIDIGAVQEQIKREPYEFPTLNIKKDITTFDEMLSLDWSDIEIINYYSHPPIKGAIMAV